MDTTNKYLNSNFMLIKDKFRDKSKDIEELFKD